MTNLDIRVLTFPRNPIVRGDRTHGLLSHNLTPVRIALVFFAPEESFHTIRNAEDLSALLAKCGERAWRSSRRNSASQSAWPFWQSAAWPGRIKRTVTGGKSVCKRRESRKLLRRQDRVRLQNHRHVNIIDFTGFSYTRDVYELRLPEIALLAKSAVGELYSIDGQKGYGVNDVRPSAKNS